MTEWSVASPASTSKGAALLTSANLVGAALGLTQTIIVASSLGAELFGVLGIVAAISGLAANFVDLRLTDLAVRLFYKSEHGPLSGLSRQQVIQACLAGNAILGTVLFLATAVAAMLAIGWFTEAAVSSGTLLLAALSAAAVYIANTVVYLLRLSERVGVMALTRVGMQLALTAVVIFAVGRSATLSSYYTALSLASVSTLAGSLIVMVVTFRRAQGINLLLPPDKRLTSVWRPHVRFMIFGNLLGYSKMLHRAADVLVVGWFADDRATGLYRFARSLTDGMYLLYDAVNQMEFPRLLRLLSDGRNDVFRRRSRRLLFAALALTVVGVTGVLLFFRPLLSLLSMHAYIEAQATVLLLILPLPMVLGMHVWVWPVLVYSGRLERFTALAFLAGVLQIAITVAVGFAAAPRVEWAAAAYAMYYPLVYLPLGVICRRALIGGQHS